MNKRILYVALGLTALMGCADDYKYDDEEPSFLGQSIYEELKTRGNYTNFVNLIDDLGYAEVLARTGSKTLFVANDEAFDKFYADNIWGVKSYSALSTAQKKLLLNSAMINNAYLLEMMSSRSTSSSTPAPGECLRRETAVSVTDSVPFFIGDELPRSYNADDKDYWGRFREKGIRLALDATSPMMIHFLPAQMANKNITNDDFKILLNGRERDLNDAFIFDAKVTEQDITCQNGYIDCLDKVLIAPQNMAEVLRTNGQTKIFSHMVDRFSAPFYSEALTYAYNLLVPEEEQVDSIYEKRYFSTRSQGNTKLNSDAGTDPKNNPSGNTVTYALNFDPGWNEYKTDDQTDKEADMAVIFAPVDEMLYDYFFQSGGKFLIDAYAPEEAKAVQSATDFENIYKAIDQIPLDVIQALINNLMKVSFNASVPSKFETIKDDAQDPMLDETHLDKIKGTLLANNGLIYVMDEVLTPAKYAAVSAPAYVAQDMHIFNYGVNQTSLDIQLNFYAYLLAMSSRFSFFVPQDKGFWYIDPVSFANDKGKQYAYYYEWNDTKKTPKCTAYSYTYDFSTGVGVLGGKVTTKTVSDTEWKNRLRDMLETHTIVHADESDIYGFDESATGVECEKEYFISKNGTPIHVIDAMKRDGGCMVEGGWQMQHESDVILGDETTLPEGPVQVMRFDDKTRETNGNGNGFAYEITSPLLPTIESAYSIMYNDPDNCSDFFNLCLGDDAVLDAIGLKTADKKKFQVFVNNKGLPAYSKETGNVVETATNVRFFNNYRYTIWVPTNEAIQDAINNHGLPTWEEMREVLGFDEEGNLPERDPDEEQAVFAKVKTMATVLVNFLKNHFQDNIVFADNVAMNPTYYETATLQHDADGNPTIYAKLQVSSSGGKQLSIKDQAGQTREITDVKNQIARDYVISGTSINSSSSIVLHGVNGVLDYKTYEGGRYDAEYATPAACKAYMDKWSLIE